MPKDAIIKITKASDGNYRIVIESGQYLKCLHASKKNLPKYAAALCHEFLEKALIK